MLQDCGEALIAIGHPSEAAALLEQAECWDEACALYVQLKSWPKVTAILPHVTSTKLHAQYALAKESEGNFNEAIRSYQQAGDMDSVVRVYLDHLADPHSASEIVLETRSIDGSKMLARFYQQIGDYDQALQFLILCGCISDAFALAQRHNKLRLYSELLDTSENAQSADYLAVAQYFENEKYTLLAGKYYFMAKEYQKALKFLLKASTFSNEENSAMSLAIDCVASSNDDRLAGQLIEFLLGETDGTPKEPKYLFRLYMARKHFKEAAKTAVIISNQEQIAGNYRSAHDLLFSMYQVGVCCCYNKKIMKTHFCSAGTSPKQFKHRFRHEKQFDATSSLYIGSRARENWQPCVGRQVVGSSCGQYFTISITYVPLKFTV